MGNFQDDLYTELEAYRFGSDRYRAGVQLFAAIALAALAILIAVG